MHTTMYTHTIYQQLEPTVDILRGKWKLAVILTLGSETKRYLELKRDVGDITQRVLTYTLRTLERDGLIERKPYLTIPPQVEYSLTPLGCEFLTIVQSIASWGEEHREIIARHQKAYDKANTV